MDLRGARRSGRSSGTSPAVQKKAVCQSDTGKISSGIVNLIRPPNDIRKSPKGPAWCPKKCALFGDIPCGTKKSHLSTRYRIFFWV